MEAVVVLEILCTVLLMPEQLDVEALKYVMWVCRWLEVGAHHTWYHTASACMWTILPAVCVVCMSMVVPEPVPALQMGGGGGVSRALYLSAIPSTPLWVLTSCTSPCYASS